MAAQNPKPTVVYKVSQVFKFYSQVLTFETLLADRNDWVKFATNLGLKLEDLTSSSPIDIRMSELHISEGLEHLEQPVPYILKEIQNVLINDVVLALKRMNNPASVQCLKYLNSWIQVLERDGELKMSKVDTLKHTPTTIKPMDQEEEEYMKNSEYRLFNSFPIYDYTQQGKFKGYSQSTHEIAKLIEADWKKLALQLGYNEYFVTALDHKLKAYSFINDFFYTKNATIANLQILAKRNNNLPLLEYISNAISQQV